LDGRVVLTPHLGEMASLLGVEKTSVDEEASELVARAAERVNATIALKGAETWISERGDAPIVFRGGVVGLGTSGSGDTLAGIVTGLAARGASPMTAASWGVWAHGMAGQALTKRVATVGFLARELLAEVPALVGE
jgi:NAD(P)H-hydrate repair Nnr-like enzyme with NAD(P)H-hydrate dehydratase domain